MCGSCKKNFRFGINFEKHIAECDPFDIVGNGTLITEKSLTGGWGEILKIIFGIIEVRDWNFFRYSIVLKIRY